VNAAAEREAPIAVLGAGSWGTALAIQLARSGRATRLWGRDGTQLRAMSHDRRNARYLPDATFPDSLTVSAELPRVLHGCLDVLVAVPSHSFRALLQEILPRLDQETRVAWATKGFELDSGKLPHEVAREVLGMDRPMAVLSGPTFAKEVGAGLPTAMTIASPDARFAHALAQGLSSNNFRAYTSNDIVGVEVGGAVKNVLAVGAGLSDGLGFGSNTRIALITRGLVEMTRLGVTLGAHRDTFMGLAGLGDLVLTCTDDQSRNRRFGLQLASGKTPEQALASIGQAVEGYLAAKAVRVVAKRANVDMPICDGIYQVLYEKRPAKDLVRDLMTRPIRAEKD
jgi:glycerol-3-phosphate dehydrogenase (NAD(P)+)